MIKKDVNTTLIATYGTLRSGNGNKYAITSHGKDAYEEIGITKIKGWKLYSLGGFPGASIDPNKELVVEVYKVNDAALRSVRNLEGYDPDRDDNTFYNEVEVDTKFGKCKMYEYVDGQGNCPLIEDGDWNKYIGVE